MPVIGRNTVSVPLLAEKDLRCSGPSGDTPVIGIIESKIVRGYIMENIISIEGDKRPDSTRDLARISVIERNVKMEISAMDLCVVFL